MAKLGHNRLLVHKLDIINWLGPLLSQLLICITVACLQNPFATTPLAWAVSDDFGCLLNKHNYNDDF